MKQTIFLLILILNSILSFAQVSSNKDIQNLTTKYLKELKEKKVDTICLFEAYSVGGYITFDEKEDSCEYESENTPTYVIWKQNGKSFLTKINNCNVYSILEIDAAKIWKTYVTNKDIIQKEKIKSFEYLVFENGKKRIATIGVDHSYHQNFELIIKDKIKEVRFDDFNFEQFLNAEEKTANINYQHNQNLKSKILMEEISKVVFNNEKLITKIKTGL